MRATVLMFVAALAAPLAASDFIVLNDGKTLAGEIVTDEKDKDIVFFVSEATVIKRADIKQIIKDTKGREKIAKLKAAAKENDVEAQLAVFQAAYEARLPFSIKEAADAVLKLDHTYAAKLQNIAAGSTAAVVNDPNRKPDPKVEWFLKLCHLSRCYAGNIPALVGYPEMEAVKALAGSANFKDLTEDEAFEELKKQRYQVGETVAAAIDARVAIDPLVRAGALKAIGKLKLKSQKISTFIAVAAVNDPVEYIRDRVTEYLWDNGDPAAMSDIIRHFVNSYGQDGAVRNKQHQENALAVLRGQKQKRLILDALMYHVSQQVEQNRLEKNQVFTGNGAIGTGVGAAPPIGVGSSKKDDDGIRNTSGKGAEQALAALKDYSGEDFEADWNKWRVWISKQK